MKAEKTRKPVRIAESRLIIAREMSHTHPYPKGIIYSLHEYLGCQNFENANKSALLEHCVELKTPLVVRYTVSFMYH